MFKYIYFREQELTIGGPEFGREYLIFPISVAPEEGAGPILSKEGEGLELSESNPSKLVFLALRMHGSRLSFFFFDVYLVSSLFQG